MTICLIAHNNEQESNKQTMTTQARTHWVFRVGDGQNFWNSSRYHIWGTKRNTSINPGDLMWFVTNNSNGHAIAVATFESLNERSYTTMTNEELGWTGDGGWNYELHYDNLYDVSDLHLLTNIKGSNSIRKYNENCEVNLPNEYEGIVRYSRAVYLPTG